MLAGARARLSMPGTHAWITKTFKERQMPNGFLMLQGDGFGNDTRGNYSEQMAAAGIVSELLLQSVGAAIRLFPAWPKDVDAQYADLRAEGGFLVSARQQGGAVVRVAVRSTAGGTLRLLSPWPSIGVRRDGRLQPLTADGRGVVAVETRAGKTLAFEGVER
jgi:hypothetical protein